MSLEFFFVGGELGEVGQSAVDEEVGDLLELAGGGEVEDVVATVVEVVAAAADGAESCVAGGGAGERDCLFGFEGGSLLRGGSFSHLVFPSAKSLSSFCS